MHLISSTELDSISAAITSLVQEYGHPDDIPMGALAEKGISANASEICETLLTDVDYPSDPGQATAKWLRRISQVTR